MIPVLAVLLHAALLLVAAPVLAGLMRRLGARLAGRGAAPVLQEWHELRRLWRKQALRPAGSGWVFAAAPAASLGATAVAGLLVPSFTLGMATAPLADLVSLAGLLAVPPAFMLLAGFETGAALAGQRRAITGLAGAPAILLLILAAALLTGSTNLDTASGVLRDSGPRLSTTLGCAGLLAVLLAGSGAGDADFAGRDLALLRLTVWLRRLVLLSLLAALALPFGLAAEGASLVAWLLGACCWALKLAVFGGIQAASAPLRARLRPAQAPELAVLGLLLAALAVAALFASQRAA